MSDKETATLAKVVGRTILSAVYVNGAVVLTFTDGTSLTLRTGT